MDIIKRASLKKRDRTIMARVIRQDFHVASGLRFERFLIIDTCPNRDVRQSVARRACCASPSYSDKVGEIVQYRAYREASRICARERRLTI